MLMLPNEKCVVYAVLIYEFALKVAFFPMTEHVFIPFSGKRPVTTSINGHRVMVVSEHKENIQDALTLLGADRLEEVIMTPSEVQKAILDLTRSNQAHVVLLPEDCSMIRLLAQLEEDLPWIH